MNYPATMVKPTDLRGILQYIPRFRDKTFVIALDGAMIRQEKFSTILQDIAVLRSLNIRVILVHGASSEIETLAQELNISPSNLDGTGITDATTLKLALTASNRLTHEILEGLATVDLRAAVPNAVIGHPSGILHGVDHLFTGKVERLDHGLLQALLSQDIIPVIPPLGFDGDGKTFRLNSDHVAVEVARCLDANKIIYLSQQDGLFHHGKMIRQIPVSDLESLLIQSPSGFQGPMLSKAQHAKIACASNIPRVHIINGLVDEGLLAELFSNEGVGTLVYANEYQQIRRALKKDIRAILRLTETSVANDELIKRTRSIIEKNISDYYIFDIDKNPVACVALHPYPHTKKGELACLFVAPSHENQGIGRKLVQYTESKAKDLGINQLFALSTQAFTFFQIKLGFRDGTPDDLPFERRQKYDLSNRKGKVLIKDLT